MAYTTVNDPTEYFNTKLYTGNGTLGHAIKGVGFKPDWVWVKDRSEAHDHKITDSSRLGGGSGPTRTLEANTTGAEYDDQGEGSDATTSFDTDGFTLGSNDNYNEKSNTYVAWCWKANGATTTTNDASSTSIGTIDSVHQANTTAGFSIVTYTADGNNNASFAHGLGTAPKWVLIKNRDTARSWLVGHHKIGFTHTTGHLNSTDDADEDAVYFNNTAPTSTVVTLGTNEAGNESGDKFVAYCFAEVQGYSKFGTYTGNGAEAGPYIYTGFKPAWLMIKNMGAAEEWVLQDSTRSIDNPATINTRVDANITEADASSLDINYHSNGFKIKSDQAQLNSNDVQYAYMAFAESPFVTSNGTPNTAR